MPYFENRISPEDEFYRGPWAPDGSGKMAGSLASIRDTLTSADIDPGIEQEIHDVVDDGSRPFTGMRDVLERVRVIPPGDRRIELMNSIVRTLGRPATLAAFLDALRDSAADDGSSEGDICRRKLQRSRAHSAYGWCGGTLLVESFEEPTEGTYPPTPSVAKRLGNLASRWSLTIHAWQPNTTARGFSINGMLDDGIILEAPHSHPFNFASTIVKGRMHQSIYDQIEDTRTDREDEEGHYGQMTLEHADGFLPPHDFRETTRLGTLEHRVEFKAGDSYYMPFDRIHDVEIDGNLAASEPALSLFLSSEHVAMQHIYVVESMVDYHSKNPDIKSTGQPLSREAWGEKLEAISAYLRGESDTLDLNRIVRHDGEYAFFHVR